MGIANVYCKGFRKKSKDDFIYVEDRTPILPKYCSIISLLLPKSGSLKSWLDINLL